MMRPQILITNDEGIEAAGLWSLVRHFEKFSDITVVAPDSEKSATGMGITIHEPIYLREYQTHEGRRGWAVGGTPVDCVKLAMDEILEKKPDIILSGINLGCNAGINALYSGTVAAALEGAIHNIPSIAISLDSYTELIFDPAAKYALKLVKNILKKKWLPGGIALNINVPALPEHSIKSPIISKQGMALFHENFDKRLTPSGKHYYWMSGEKYHTNNDLDTDENAVRQGHIAITPIRPNLTANNLLSVLQDQFREN